MELKIKEDKNPSGPNWAKDMQFVADVVIFDQPQTAPKTLLYFIIKIF